MQAPAALEKAQVLRDYAVRTGYQLSTFAVTLSEAEALEVLDYIEAGGFGIVANHELLIADCHEARKRGNPWPVLEAFHVYGLAMAPIKALH